MLLLLSEGSVYRHLLSRMYGAKNSSVDSLHENGNLMKIKRTDAKNQKRKNADVK